MSSESIDGASDALAPLGIAIDVLPLSPERIRRLIEGREAEAQR
jgi:hypothetical protein